MLPADWHKSRQIWSYIAAVREAAIGRYGVVEPGGELDQWLLWANQQADRIDPLLQV